MLLEDKQPVSKPMDSKAFEILVREHHRRLLGYAHSLVSRSDIAEDLVQDAFITAYRKLDKYDGSRPFSAWVRGIIRMKYLEWVRSQKEIVLDNDVLDMLDASHQNWDEAEDSPGAAFQSLRSCMSKLPESFGKLIDLFYMKQMSGRHVAEQLNISEANVRKRLERARKNLAICIKKHSSEVDHA